MTNKQSEPDTEVVHIDGCNGKHLVSVKSLKVLLSKDGDSWFAQGLEIDYASAGGSVDEAKRNFESGLRKTIAEYLKLCGSIEGFLTPADNEAWKEYYAADEATLRQAFSTVQFHEIAQDTDLDEDLIPKFPFHQIEFLEKIAA